MSTALSAPPDVPRAPVQRPSRGARVRWVVVALTSLAIVGLNTAYAVLPFRPGCPTSSSPSSSSGAAACPHWP